jgi:DNA-binding NtrC family response regulator
LPRRHHVGPWNGRNRGRGDRLGAADFIEKPLSLAKLLRTVENALESESLAKAGKSQPSLPPSWVPVGKSPQIVALRRRAEEIAPHAAPIMIIGESGTGREVIGRYIHSVSARQIKPFVTVVGASLTAENAATLLLGAESIDGPADIGYLEQANEGTLFIDELGDLCPAGQLLLQGVLDQGSFARLGRAQATPVNIRVIASIPSCCGILWTNSWIAMRYLIAVSALLRKIGCGIIRGRAIFLNSQAWCSGY